MINDNGANQNVEEILASIRTSIAEEPGPARLVAGERTSLLRPAVGDEAAEFELPAMFKPGHPASVERPKLFGRLSEALKTAPSDAGGRTVIPFDPVAAGRMIEPPAAPTLAAPVQPAPAQEPMAEDTTVARTMPSFFDTRLNRMGELTREVYAPKPEPAPVAKEPPAQPPALPVKAMTVHAADAPDDAAAQLLRPMLRAWLHENMPKIVERALLSEITQQGGGSPRD